MEKLDIFETHLMRMPLRKKSKCFPMQKNAKKWKNSAVIWRQILIIACPSNRCKKYTMNWLERLEYGEKIQNSYNEVIVLMSTYNGEKYLIDSIMLQEEYKAKMM